jgi:hypothetical protein
MPWCRHETKKRKETTKEGNYGRKETTEGRRLRKKGNGRKLWKKGCMHYNEHC